jgi:hypothetical protein
MSETVGMSIEKWLRNRHWSPILTYWSLVVGCVCLGFTVGYNMTSKHPYWGSIFFFLAFFLFIAGGWNASRASHKIKWACTALVSIVFAIADYYWIKSINEPTPWMVSYIASHAAWILVCVLAILLIAVLTKRNQDAPLGLDHADKPSTVNEEVQALDDPLPPSRPIVVPIRYGKITSGPEAGHSGISLRNDGGPAYSVSARSVTLAGVATIHMDGTPQQLRQGEPELSFPSWRESEGGGSLGSGLYYFMVENKLDSITIPVTYRDADFNWYQTDVLLIKDQMARSAGGSESGIRVD